MAMQSSTTNAGTGRDGTIRSPNPAVNLDANRCFRHMTVANLPDEIRRMSLSSDLLYKGFSVNPICSSNGFISQ